MKKLLSTLICATILSTGAAMANDKDAQTPPPPPFKHGQFQKKPPCPKMLEDKLNLTEEQKAAARKNRMEGRKEMKPIIEKIRNNHDEMINIMDSDLPQAEKDKKISAIKEDMKKLKAQADKIRIENMKKFEAILTDEQKAQFDKIKAEKKKFKKHHSKKMKKFQKPVK